jgi:hypothetical protein
MGNFLASFHKIFCIGVAHQRCAWTKTGWRVEGRY